MIDIDWPALRRAALEAMGRAYAPYSQFPVGAAALSAGPPGFEHAVKATYLHKIAAFVEWPATVFDAPDSPLVLCVAGSDPVGRIVGDAVSPERVDAGIGEDDLHRRARRRVVGAGGRYRQGLATRGHDQLDEPADRLSLT